MNDRGALLRAILENPDDDTPRLVFADWLDEHGEPDRAEFIRVQMKLAQADEWSCGARLPDGIAGGVKMGCPDCKLRRRERELWGGPAFMDTPAGFRSLMGFNPDNPPEGSALFTARGFYEIAVCPTTDWLAHANALLAEHPIREVTLTTMPTITTIGHPDRPADILAAFTNADGIAVDWWYKIPDTDEFEPRLTITKMLAEGWPRVKVWNLPLPF